MVKYPLDIVSSPVRAIARPVLRTANNNQIAEDTILIIKTTAEGAYTCLTGKTFLTFATAIFVKLALWAITTIAIRCVIWWLIKFIGHYLQLRDQANMSEVSKSDIIKYVLSD